VVIKPKNNKMNNRRIFLKRMNLFASCAGLILMLYVSSCNNQHKQIQTLKNPLIDESGMSDPHMLVVDDVCYVFTGHDVGFGIADWVMPDWRIYRSIDMH
jgi:hypothetical protein